MTVPTGTGRRHSRLRTRRKTRVGLRADVLPGRSVTGLQRQPQQGVRVERVFVVGVGGKNEPVVKRLDHCSSLTPVPADYMRPVLYATCDRFEGVALLGRCKWPGSEQVDDSLGFVLAQPLRPCLQ